ncbi:GNAT family N-acetyltransferase [Mangrovitalea sediminis]|uniref:GNAT family N-acetyltransferase n=1 Tax=Mangrovitalea sediminis TaxID=1982043 RepID=UPI000BE5D658|nr:GNAT family N-acetyltransferase [Mangrovitalea sediminis]
MIVIEAFSAEHQQGVVDVILPIQQGEFDIPITLEAQPDLLNIAGFYQTGAGNFWVAIADGQVVGTLALLDIGNGQGALRKMFVKPEYRGREFGVATMLLDHLLTWSRNQGITAIYLGTTAKFLAAHRFYERSGFTEIEKAALPEAFPVMSVDTKFYSLTLG